MIIWRPSIFLGKDSTTASSAVSSLRRFRTSTPMSWCAISRPRKRIVTFTLLPSSRKRVRLRSFTDDPGGAVLRALCLHGAEGRFRLPPGGRQGARGAIPWRRHSPSVPDVVRTLWRATVAHRRGDVRVPGRRRVIALLRNDLLPGPIFGPGIASIRRRQASNPVKAPVFPENRP